MRRPHKRCCHTSSGPATFLICLCGDFCMPEKQCPSCRQSYSACQCPPPDSPDTLRLAVELRKARETREMPDAIQRHVDALLACVDALAITERCCQTCNHPIAACQCSPLDQLDTLRRAAELRQANLKYERARRVAAVSRLLSNAALYTSFTPSMRPAIKLLLDQAYEAFFPRRKTPRQPDLEEAAFRQNYWDAYNKVFHE